MSSARTNLNDNVDSVFPFSIGGYDYDLKYPTLEELEPVQDITAKREELLDKTDDSSKEELAKLDKALEEAFYGFILPVKKDQPSIQDTLKKQPFPVVRAFNKMISEQLSVN